MPIVQLGSGTVQTTGYKGAAWTGGGSGINNTIGFYLINSIIATDKIHFIMTLVNITGNLWAASHTGGFETIYLLFGGGSVTLSGVLDRLRLTTFNGTDQFDSGTVNIMWE